MSARSRAKPWFRKRVTMKEFLTKLDAAREPDDRALFKGGWIVIHSYGIVDGGPLFPQPRDRRGRFTKPGKPDW